MRAAPFDRDAPLFDPAIAKVVEVDHLLDLGKAEADVLGAHDPRKAGPVALRVYARQAVAGRLDQPFVLVKTQRAGGAFRAELRGLTEALNRPLGRVFQKPCTAVLGDAACGFDLATAGYAVTLAAQKHEDGRVFRWEGINGFDDAWFARGRLEVLDGPAAGLWGVIKHDRVLEGRSSCGSRSAVQSPPGNSCDWWQAATSATPPVG